MDDSAAAGVLLKLYELRTEAKLREARAAKPEGTPEYAEANKLVQAKKGEIADLEAKLAAPGKAPAEPAVPKPTAAEEEYAKARKALDEAVAQATLAKNELTHWKRAAAFMDVYRTKARVGEKQARHDELVAFVKEAMLPAEDAAAKLAAAERAAEEAPAILREREALFAQLAQTADMLNKTVGPAEAAFTQKEAEEKAAAEQATKAANALSDARKQLDKQKEEVAKLREMRATKAAGTPEYAEADAKVQAKKKEIAETENGIAAGQAKVSDLQPRAETLRTELAKAREGLDKARAEAKSASEKAGAAEKALADARKTAESAKGEVEKLRKEAPELKRTATEAKAKAEAELAGVVKELENAKSELKRVQAEFEAKWKPVPGAAPTVAA